MCSRIACWKAHITDAGSRSRLQDKVVIVTGGGQGIGRACSLLLAAEGAAVVVADIEEARGQAVADEIRRAGGLAEAFRADVTREEDCEALVAAAVRTYGRLAGLVNNVGWFPRASLQETSADLWHQVLEVNLTGAFYCCSRFSISCRTSPPR